MATKSPRQIADEQMTNFIVDIDDDTGQHVIDASAEFVRTQIELAIVTGRDQLTEDMSPTLDAMLSGWDRVNRTEAEAAEFMAAWAANIQHGTEVDGRFL